MTGICTGPGDRLGWGLRDREVREGPELVTQETGPQQREGVKVYRRKVLCGGNQVVCLRKLLETTVATAENREDMSCL